MRTIFVIVLCAAALGGVGCTTYVSDLDRAQQHFQTNQHERALALFRVLEPDMDSFDHADRARYAYLRGMNNYRLSGHNDDASSDDSASPTEMDKAFRAHARYWIGLARALEQQKPGSLRPEWKAKANSALRDLNQDVFGVGVFVDDEDSVAFGGGGAQETSNSDSEEDAE